ncbi:uncharacterized protein TNCV_4005921 [Trichonephila clavipes]|nr:uncharacterized protein TNCV_4005921 [Trichonephila clavipes]
MKTTVLPHISYSSDFAPYNFRIFLKVTRPLHGRQFQSADEVKSATQAGLKVIAENGFQNVSMNFTSNGNFESDYVAAVAKWYRYRTVTCFVTGSSPVPLKTRRVGQRCPLNLSRAETSSRWCGVVVRRGGASSGVVHVT